MIRKRQDKVFVLPILCTEPRNGQFQQTVAYVIHVLGAEPENTCTFAGKG